jgi:hypothetical protein
MELSNIRMKRLLRDFHYGMQIRLLEPENKFCYLY